MAARETRRGHRSGRAASAVTVAARATLVALVGLVFWTLVPALLGWHPTVVMSGSMAPRLRPGDVVVTRPVVRDAERPGQVLLFDDPDHPGRLRLHRYVRSAPGGRLVTEGDANARPDSSPIAEDAVHGVAALRVPFVGLPALWWRDGDRVRPLGVLLALGLLVAFATRRLPAANPSPRAGPAVPARRPTPGPRSPATAPRRPRPGVLPSPVAAITVAALVIVGGATAVPGRAAADGGFGAAAPVPRSTLSAARYFTCAGAVTVAGAAFSWPLGEPGGTVAADVTGHGSDGTYSATGVGYGVPGPCSANRSSTGNAVSLDGGSGSVTAVGTVGGLTDLSLAVWFRSSGTHGGPLMAVTNTTLTASFTTEALSLTADGRIVLGVTTIGTRALTAPGRWNDDAWHLAVGVLGAGGTALYLDGQPAAAADDPAVATAVANIAGTPAAGAAHAAGLPAGVADHFRGALAFATLYRFALSATDVAAQYAAA